MFSSIISRIKVILNPETILLVAKTCRVEASSFTENSVLSQTSAATRTNFSALKTLNSLLNRLNTLLLFVAQLGVSVCLLLLSFVTGHRIK